MIDIILSVWNISNRGYERVLNMLFSLSLQRSFFGKIFIIDGGKEYASLNNSIKRYTFTDHVRFPKDEFNKPMMINEGIRLSSADYCLVTDCDYIFSPDLLRLCSQYVDKDEIIFKEVFMLPRMKITEQNILKWNFPRCKLNQWGHLANGAMQLACRNFFLKNPYPEQMSGFGAMDNIMAYMAKAEGLQIQWMKEGVILHQWHPIFKFRTKEDTWRFKRNQYILEQYKKSHNLEKIL